MYNAIAHLGANLVRGYTAADITDLTITIVITAPTNGQSIHLTSFTVTNGHATTDTLVSLLDGSGGSVLWLGYASHGCGGWTLNISDAPLKLTANTGLWAVCGTTAAAVRVAASGYTGK